jgi:biopolymer transport protein ExbB
LVGALLVAQAPAALAASWWNGDWGFRKEITLDGSANAGGLAGTASDVPVLVRLSVGNFAYFGDANPDGSDFRVVGGDDKTPLKFHFERYDAQNQMAYLWVRAPHVGTAPEKIFVYYGNKSAPAGADVPGTYDVDQSLVLHFAADGKPQDATAYANQPSASTAEPVPASFSGAGAKFAGAQSITVPATASLRALPSGGFTASAWVKVDAAQKRATVIALEDGAKQIVLGIDGLKPFARYAGAATPVTVQAAADVAAGQWHHLAVRVGGGQVGLVVDGAEAGTQPVQAVEVGGTLTVGASAAGADFLVGEIDEVQVSKVARSVDWLKASARSQSPDAPLVAYGADGQKEGGSQSYFVTIAKNLTVDGWVVIVICMLMLAMALVVMVMKALWLSRIEKANRRFLEAYQAVDAAAIVGAGAHPDRVGLTGDAVQGSTLAEIYQSGMTELGKRMHAHGPASAATADGLSAASVEAIRAALDAVSTRLQQRLSARMVLLTIAISGGPFLGLLGTVIGVMITFAAIAASGDVNVNAIAPGTAAALAATVAGLAVAIPCLFGYNWLNTRIKSISVGNRVFLDEFVARLAEEHT